MTRAIPVRAAGRVLRGGRFVLLAVLAFLTLPMVGSVSPAVAQDEKPRNYAILIGVNSTMLESAPKLQYAEKDALALAEELKSLGWTDPPPVVIDTSNATRVRIIGELTRLARIAQPQDSVLIYFAGHGVRDTVVGKHTYWLTYNSDQSNLAVEGIRLSHLLDHVMDIPAAHKLVILDHCYSGDIVAAPPAASAASAASGGGRDGVTVRPGLLVPRNLEPEELAKEVKDHLSPALALLGAARGSAFEYADLGHGVFTWALLQALRTPGTDSDDDDSLSLDEIWRRTTSLLGAKALEKQIVQTPLQHLEGAVLSWKLFPVRESSGNTLLDFVDEIDRNQTLQSTVRMVCIQAVRNWQARRQQELEPDPQDLLVVQELQGLRAAPPSMSWSIKKETLERRLRNLGLIP